MIRKSFITILALAALAVLTTGVISYWRGLPGNTLWIDSADDAVRVRLAMIDGVLHTVYSGPREVGRGLYDKELGQFYIKRVGIGDVDAAGVGVPFWALFVVLGAMPFMTLVRGPFVRRKRRRLGLCQRCGYNLTGLAEPRCPECGRSFTT